MLETLGYTIRIGSTPTILYFDWYIIDTGITAIKPFSFLLDVADIVLAFDIATQQYHLDFQAFPTSKKFK